MKIHFSQRELIYSIVICFIGILFFTYLIFSETSLSSIPIFIFLIIVVIYVLTLRIKQLKRHKKGDFALIVDQKGIWNNTPSKPIFISWEEITEFQTGFSRTREIYISPKNPSDYKTKQLFGINFNTKNQSLWIDSDMLLIKKKELLFLLNQEMRNFKNK